MFKYKDLVKVTDGFYKGFYGTLIREYQVSDTLYEYDVEFIEVNKPSFMVRLSSRHIELDDNAKSARDIENDVISKQDIYDYLINEMRKPNYHPVLSTSLMSDIMYADKNKMAEIIQNLKKEGVYNHEQLCDYKKQLADKKETESKANEEINIYWYTIRHERRINNCESFPELIIECIAFEDFLTENNIIQQFGDFATGIIVPKAKSLLSKTVFTQDTKLAILSNAVDVSPIYNLLALAYNQFASSEDLKVPVNEDLLKPQSKSAYKMPDNLFMDNLVI